MQALGKGVELVMTAITDIRLVLVLNHCCESFQTIHDLMKSNTESESTWPSGWVTGGWLMHGTLGIPFLEGSFWLLWP